MADSDGVSTPLGALARYLKFLRLLLKAFQAVANLRWSYRANHRLGHDDAAKGGNCRDE